MFLCPVCSQAVSLPLLPTLDLCKLLVFSCVLQGIGGGKCQQDVFISRTFNFSSLSLLRPDKNLLDTNNGEVTSWGNWSADCGSFGRRRRSYMDNMMMFLSVCLLFLLHLASTGKVSPVCCHCTAMCLCPSCCRSTRNALPHLHVILRYGYSAAAD